MTWLTLKSTNVSQHTLSVNETAAAAAKSLQLCPTLCDPRDGSPPGSPIPGILQARTLEWVAISFANAWKWKVKVKSLSHMRLAATPWTAAYQAPPSVGFSRQEYWSGVPLPSPVNETKPHQSGVNHLLGTKKPRNLMVNYSVMSGKMGMRTAILTTWFLTLGPLILLEPWDWHLNSCVSHIKREDWTWSSCRFVLTPTCYESARKLS